MNYLTTWTPPDPSSPAPASAATGGSDAPVQHPGWCEAYDSLMIELVAGLTAGPAFLALLGPAGTGKTWLLHAAAAGLRRRGQPAILVRRGELPIEVFPGTAVLVDEAARMDDRQLARLAAVRDASIVLADLPAFAVRLDQLARPPAIVPLAPLAPGDMPEFVAAWLGARGLPVGMLTHSAVARLFDHSGGVPRLVVQLLRAALAMHGGMGAASIGPDAVDEMAALRLGGFDAGTAQPAVQDAPHPSPEQPGIAQDAPGMAGEESAADPAPPSEAPLSKAPAIPPSPEPAPAAHTSTAPPAGVSVQPRRRIRRAARAAVLPALAASLLMAAALAVRHVQQAPSNRDTVLAASGTAPSAASAPHDAEIPAASSMIGPQPPPVHVPDADASVAIQAPPEAAPSVPPSPSPAPTIEATPAPPQEVAVAASPAQAADPAPNLSEPPPAAPAQAVIPPMPDEGRRAAVPSITVMAPPAVPSPPEPAPAPPSEAPEPQSLAQASGAPGLVLVAHAGDTMPALYAKVYRGVRPPPYSDVVAANHVPLRPGAIVVFPAPQDGWLGR